MRALNECQSRGMGQCHADSVASSGTGSDNAAALLVSACPSESTVLASFRPLRAREAIELVGGNYFALVHNLRTRLAVKDVVNVRGAR